jgi:anti-sigma B factor antagonist
VWNSIGVTSLSVSPQSDDGRSVLSLSGDLDMAAVPQLREEAERRLSAADGAALCLDLAGLTFLDSSGLGVLVELRTRARTQGVEFELRNVPSGPARIIAIAGLAETLGLPPAEAGDAT